MSKQFKLARQFLRQVIAKGRQLHDSDGEGLSEDEPGRSCQATESILICRSRFHQHNKSHRQCSELILRWCEAFA